VHFNLFSKIGAVLAVLGILGYAIFFPFTTIEGEEFMQYRKDANTGAEDFTNFDVGDKVIVYDTIVRMQYGFEPTAPTATSIWVESIGKSDQSLRFVCDSNYMDDFGIGDKVVLKLEIIDKGESEAFLCEATGRLSTPFEYASIGSIIVGIGLAIFGFVKPRKQPVSDDWGTPAPPAMAPAPPAMAPAPPAMAPAPPAMAPAPPGLAPQPQNPPSMAAIPEAPPAPAAAPTSMTITVPPGVVSGQVLTVTMPNGQVVNVQVPPGCPPGSQFTISVTQ
jgi:hypothetical protein